MATVPLYGQPRVGSSPVPGARVSTDAPIEAFGGGRAVDAAFGQARGLSQDAARIAINELEKANEVELLSAKNNLLKLRADLDIGAQNMKLKDAQGASNFVAQGWQKGVENIEKGLSNEHQRAAFRNIATGEFGHLNAKVQYHMDREAKARDNMETEGLLETMGNELARDPSDVNVTLTIPLMDDELTRWAERNGVDTKGKGFEAHRAKVISGAYSTIINSRLDAGDSVGAKAYFDKVRGEMTEADLRPIENAVKRGSLLGEAFAVSDRILATGKDWKERFDMVKGIENPELRAAAKNRLEDEKRTEDMLEADRLHEVSKEAFNILEQTGDITKIHPNVWENDLTVEQRRSLETRSRQIKEGVEPVTDDALFHRLVTESSSPLLVDKFLTEEMETHRPYLEKSDWEYFVKLQASIRKEGTGPNNKLLRGTTTEAQAVDQALREAGIDPTPSEKDTVDVKSVGQFRKLLNAQVIKRQIKENRELIPDEVREEADKLLIAHTVKRYGSLGISPFLPSLSIDWMAKDKTKRAFELTVEDIPASDQAGIRQALQVDGLPITEENMLEYYRVKLERASRGAK